MKFFNFILISSYPFGYWVYPGGAQDTLEPSHQLYFPYSKPHILQPRSAGPNTACSKQDTLAGEVVKFDLSTSLQVRLCSERVGIQHEREHDPYSQLLSESTHSLHCKSEQPSLDIEPEHRLLGHGNDTSSPIQYVLLNDSRNGILCDYIPSRKTMKFIETKVPAINCRVLTNV